MLLNSLLVGIGGFFGSILRYQFSVWIPNSSGQISKATLLANVSGCLILGAITGWSTRNGGLAPAVTNMVIVGFVGGFTTFSALALDTVTLTQSSQVAIAVLNIALNLVLGICLLWAMRLTFGH